MRESRANPAGDDALEGLLAECLERLSRGDTDPLDEMCAAHPSLASELRRRQAGLADLGLWSRPTAVTQENIGSFELLRELGRGGMGIVHLAQQTGPIRRLAAVKVTAGRATPQALARFNAERQALAMLVHPNIAQVLEAGTTDKGEPWYAMEFVDGRPLTTYCDDHRLDIDARLALFLQLCDAVQFAHQQGVLHRDLKPGNVLVCERGGKPLVKVIDFGLAKALQEPFGDSHDLTEAGQILGTPEYMSPEQAMPTAAGVDTRTDIYALGVMLYELCAGVLPFDFLTLRKQGFRALQLAVCEQDPPPPDVRVQRMGEHARQIADRSATTVDRLVRRLAGDLGWITGRAIAKDRNRRYATASELGADVRRHLRHEPVQAGPPSTVYQLRKFVRRHRAGVAFGATLAAGLVTALIVVSNLLVQVTDTLESFDALDYADEFAALEARADEDLWRSPERLEQFGDLWPAVPDRLPGLEEWLAQARAITDRLPEFRRQLTALEASGELRGASWHFDERRDKSLHARLAPLVERCAAAIAAGGVVEKIQQRRDWAANLRERTVTGPDVAARWRDALATIADEGRCPAYKGLRMQPQVGLVPLGRDEQSRLYEFAFLRPDQQLPERGDGRWLVTEDTCMVFVLIPGGEARIGIDWPDARLPEELCHPPDTRPPDSEYLANDDSAGGRSIRVQLDPFLLSKYEMTHAQWENLMGESGNPSMFSPRAHGAAFGVTRTHPVNSLAPRVADEAVRRLGLTLPTSAQWQHAARAGAEAPWWTGFAADGWYGAENLADLSLARNTKKKLEFGELDTAHDDGHALTAAVDSMRPNPFGLHHVLGNAQECSRDSVHIYRDALPREGDGLMVPIVPGKVLDKLGRDILGGAFASSWLYARSTLRTQAQIDQAGRPFGLRPARPLDTR